MKFLAPLSAAALASVVAAIPACAGQAEPTRTGGPEIARTPVAASSSGATSTGGNAGVAAAAGGANAAGSADAGPTTPAAIGCGNCNPALEQCFNNRLCVAKLVKLPAGYSIDATEVTAAQYKAWLATKPATTALPGYCTSWKSNYSDGGGDDDQPIGFVDWCDAYAYCKAVGKRLCGKIGGGPNAFNDYGDRAKSQWYNACSSHGAGKYPYGKTYDADACDGIDYSSSPKPVSSLTRCQSSVAGYAGVYDLSGNVWEWEDSCNKSTGSLDICRVRGGSYRDGAPELACGFGSSWFLRPGSSAEVIGFRCCSGV